MERINYKIVLAFLVSIGCSHCALTPIQEAEIDLGIRSYFLAEKHIPGFGLTIVQDGEILYSKGHGYSDIEKKKLVTNSTLFGLGSVTKAITSALTIKTLMELFPDRGLSVMDTPIAQLGPSLNFTFSDRYRTENINFKDLLSHRHCLGQSGLSLLVGSIPTPREFAYRQRYVGQWTAFRSGCFSYSNEIYGFAGEALAQMANTTYTELMTKFMREIGMQDALVLDKDYAYVSNPNMNHGYYWREDLQANQPFNITLWSKMHVAVGGGGIMASPRDLGAFLKFHLSHGMVGDKQVMTPEQLNVQYDVAEKLGFGGEKHSQTDYVSGNIGYGLGLAVVLVDGWKTYQHAGNFPPFRNKITFSHTQNLGIFTTTNSMNNINEVDLDAVHIAVANAIRKNVTEGIYANIISEMKSKMLKKEVAVLPKSDFEYLLNFNSPQVPLPVSTQTKEARAMNVSEMVGVYGNNIDGNLEIYMGANKTLSMTYGTHGLATLDPFTENDLNEYIVNWTTDVLQQFWSDSGYRLITFKLQFNPNLVHMFMDDGHISTFNKNTPLSSAPAIPWAPDSCSP